MGEDTSAVATAKQRFIEAIKAKHDPQVIDVGAFRGEFTWIAAGLGAWVLAFEPRPDLAEYVRAYAKANGLDRVSVVEAALMDRQGTQILKIPETEQGLATLGSPLRFTEWTREIAVQAFTLDDYYPPNEPDVIKIDTEGAELMVLQGGAKMLQECKPDLLIEYTQDNTQQFDYDVSEIDQFLRDIGYRNFELVQPWDMWVTWR
jgi:FkbM family methyltransferase